MNQESPKIFDDSYVIHPGVAYNPNTSIVTLHMLATGMSREEAEAFLEKQKNENILNGCKNPNTPQETLFPKKDYGSCRHIVETKSQCVHVYNDDDGFYYQVFNTKDELNDFINQLKNAADEVWPTT